MRQVLHPGDQGADNTVAVLAFDFDQHDKARAAFDQRGDMAVSGAAQQVAFPVAGNGAILDFCWSVPDRHASMICPRV